MKGGEIINIIHKCAVIECNNRVKLPGTLCKKCMEDYINDDYMISKCSICEKLVSIGDPGYIGKMIMEGIESRVVPTICKNCEQIIKENPLYGLSEKDLEELGIDPEDIDD